MKIVSYKDYVAGWIDVSIHDFLEHLSSAAPGIKFALVTCLDSNPDPASLLGGSPELKAISKRAVVVGRGLLLPTQALLDADSRRQIFFGFDEIWFFPSKNVAPKPKDVSIVGPARLNQVRLRKLGRWMAQYTCSLALGGGEGLNFVVQARGPAKYLLGYSIEQPEPALAFQGSAAH